jgi:hypothetical protein
MANVILHLTDLHFGWRSTSPIDLADRQLTLDGILNSLSSLPAMWKPSVIVVSGDLGWAGKNDDYLLASEWLQKLITVCGLTWEDIVLCPGNHDIDRARTTNILKPQTPSEADARLTLPLDPILQSPFNAYIDFCRSKGVVPFKVGDTESHLVGERVYKGIRFVSFNSAWYSGEDERGRLWIGYPFMKLLEVGNQFPIVKGLGFALPTVAVVHHPFDWLHGDESHAYSTRANVKDYLANRCHILLTGHEHAEIREPDRIANGMYHFGGPAGYAGSDHPNGFRLIKIEDLENIQHISYLFDPRESGNDRWRVASKGALPILLNRNLEFGASSNGVEPSSPEPYPFQDLDGKSLNVGDFFEYVTIVGGHVPPRERNIFLIAKIMREDDCILTYDTLNDGAAISTFVLVHQRMNTIVRRKLDPQFVFEHFRDQYGTLTRKAMSLGLHT